MTKNTLLRELGNENDFVLIHINAIMAWQQQIIRRGGHGNSDDLWILCFVPGFPAVLVGIVVAVDSEFYEVQGYGKDNSSEGSSL